VKLTRLIGSDSAEVVIDKKGPCEITVADIEANATDVSVFPYIFQAKYIRNKKINENKLVGGTTTWGTTRCDYLM
jgi:hypothetical protein